MQIRADKQTAVGALILSLMFVRCDQGEPSLTTPWGLRAEDVERATQTVSGWSEAVNSKLPSFGKSES